jgi:hypothetical protein
MRPQYNGQERITNMPTCDICGRPATHHFCYATCNAGGGGANTPTKSVSLCAEHAVLHTRAQCQLSLAEVLRTLETFAKTGTRAHSIELTVATPDERSAQNVRRGMLELCGGESLVLSPEAIAENVRQVAVKLYGAGAPKISTPDARWNVRWASDTTMSVLDRWQTGGWSQRLYELIVAHDCELHGWHLGPGRNEAATKAR